MSNESQLLRVASNLALDEAVNRLKASGREVLHLGFGESRLPIFPGLVEALAAGAGRASYGPVAGSDSVLASVAGYFDRRRMPTDPSQIAVAPGSKALLLALVAAVPGDVILPEPAWVTYAPQARLFGRRVISVPIPADCGGIPDPELVGPAIAQARAEGAHPRILVLTLPDNPTGTTAGPELVKQVCAVAEAADLLVVSDEIYRDIIFGSEFAGDNGDDFFLSPAEVLPERTVVVTGLSKSLSLGGWRIGAARFPPNAEGEQLRQRVLAVASQSWSSLSGPMQAVAEYAFAEPTPLVAHRRASSRLHAAVATAVSDVFVKAGIACRPPTGGFYVYPDLESHRGRLESLGAGDSAALQAYLLEQCGVAVLGGHHFGDQPEALRFRAATSLLYGQTDQQRWESLRSAEPTGLAHIRAQLNRAEEVFDQLVGSRI